MGEILCVVVVVERKVSVGRRRLYVDLSVIDERNVGVHEEGFVFVEVEGKLEGIFELQGALRLKGHSGIVWEWNQRYGAICQCFVGKSLDVHRRIMPRAIENSRKSAS